MTTTSSTKYLMLLKLISTYKQTIQLLSLNNTFVARRLLRLCHFSLYTIRRSYIYSVVIFVDLINLLRQTTCLAIFLCTDLRLIEDDRGSYSQASTCQPSN